ncbi:head-tail connector protein [uncultured Clostridium sp.]|uniref:head-tail connector protein n=1 Tax=uncultured Clostridium sp. TaxID=59620 RepID=UPI0028E34A70|nr:head-tail connector protein [uncultured Clostridium sp.]
MDIEDIKSYGKIDDEENKDIKELQLGAEMYLKNAGVKEDYTNPLYRLAIKILVNQWNENRTPEVIGKQVTKFGFSLDSIITQLKYCK